MSLGTASKEVSESAATLAGENWAIIDLFGISALFLFRSKPLLMSGSQMTIQW